MRVRGVSSIAAFCLTSATLLAQVQNDRPQFRAGVELIQLDVVVLDGKRQPVAGLTEADFIVLDDGKPTPIRAFTPVQLATPTRANEAVWASQVAADVFTNQIGAQEGRLLIILLDRTIPPQEATTAAKKIAVAAVEAMGPNDLGAVVSTMNGAVQDASVQNLTADRTRLLRAIEFASPSVGISPIAEQWQGKLDPLIDGQCLCGVCVPETIARVADAVRDLPRRRKVLFFIGSDVLWQTPSQSVLSRAALSPAPLACENPLKDARNAMLAAVDRAGLTVHSIDPSGLSNMSATAQAGISGGGIDGVAGARYGPNVRLEKQRTLAMETIGKRESLALLPSRTGGRTIVGMNNPEQVVPAIVNETSASYVLGIERATSTRPDRTRSIEVKVGRKGLQVHAQRQYGPPPAPIDPLQALLPSAGLPLSLSVLSFANPGDGKPIVRMNVDAGAFARPDGSPTSLEVVVLAVDRTGKPVASARQTSIVSAPASTASAKREVNVQSHLELDPGDYGIRVSITDPVTGNVASVFADTTVPEFELMPISLSAVSVEAPGRLSAASGAMVSAAATLMPTTNRTFERAGHVRAVLQIYQGTRRTDAILPVSLRVQILDARGQAVEDQSLPFPEKLFTNRRADCVITLPLSKLSAGEYLLKLEASSSRQTSSRELRFSIR